jgi:hypothetical protein
MNPVRPSRAAWVEKRFLLVALTVGVVSSGSVAAACDSSSCSLLTRGDNGLVPKKTLRLDLSFGYSDQGRLLQGSQEVASVFRPRVDLEHHLIFPAFHRDINGYDRVVQLDAVYGLARRFNLVVSLPVAVWHAHDVAHGSLQQEYGTTGLGDALLGVRWALGPPGLSGGLSVKLPTGSYRVGGEFGGGIQDPTLQPGTGAVDFVASLQYALPTDFLRLRWSVAGSYQATTTNSLDYRFGNQTVVVTGVARSLSKSLSASLQAKLFHQNRNQYVGQGVPSTGSTFVYVTPGLHLKVPHNLSLYAFLLLVPYGHVNEAQLGPRVAVLTGVSKLF